MKCIFAKNKPSHYTRSKFIDHNCLRLKWENVIFVILSRSKISTSLANPFLSLNNFSFIKKSRLRSYPTLGAREISMIKKNDKAVRKPKRKRAQETQMLGIMPTSQEKSKGQVKFQWSRKMIKPWESQKEKEPKKLKC